MSDYQNRNLSSSHSISSGSYMARCVAFGVRTRSDAFNAFKGKLNAEPVHQSSSTYSSNLKLDRGPVHEKSGSNHGSELNLCITTLDLLIQDLYPRLSSFIMHN